MSNVPWQIQSEIARMRQQEFRAEAENRRTWREARRAIRDARRVAREAARMERAAKVEATAKASTAAITPQKNTAPRTT